MNTEARNNIHSCKESLQSAQKDLRAAEGEAENSYIKNQITTQLNQVTNCLQECDKIAAGLSQFLNGGKSEDINN
jgi:hypothetical protein